MDRILCRAAETGHGEEAFGMLKATLCRMQARDLGILLVVLLHGMLCYCRCSHTARRCS